ncbi:MAG: pullulanase [Bacteroidetes bacterium]|nr:pullulanase [Bacteroidota bacterium]
MYSEQSEFQGHNPHSSHSVSVFSADQINLTTFFVRTSGLPFPPGPDHIRVFPETAVLAVNPAYDGYMVITEPLRWDENYSVSVLDSEPRRVNPDEWLNTLYSDKPLGVTVSPAGTGFGVFAPRATWVRLVLFSTPDSENYIEFEMNRDENGVWELFFPENLTGKAYGYRVAGKPDETEWFNPDVVIADPYSHAMTSVNTWHHSSRTLILDESFDWQGDTFLRHNLNELVIYETHLRDLTVHPSSGCTRPGTYLGFIEENQTGGLPHLRKMGVNAVEFLPLMEYGKIEIPYQKQVENGMMNTWNAYSRNHWGYMTTGFFAPESYYATDGHLIPGQRIGASGRQVTEMKEMVRVLHENNIAVILDVVYNHVSQYNHNPLKLIDKKYYFRLDEWGNPLSESGCGNDFKTERPMARRLILDSIRHWMTHYHIDGFRFDLAQLIDKETCAQIYHEARKINPNVFLVAEPWGGGYDPNGFADIGWASWNDQIRNGLKGFHPHDENKGLIFGRFFNQQDFFSLVRFVRGSLRQDGGQFHRPSQNVNYLESHDDHTFGDFIRLATGRVKPGQKIDDLTENARLTSYELKLHKLAATLLFTAQGNVMIAQGQEFGRSKVTAPSPAHDPHIGEIDHNSYEKDNETNFINFSHLELNEDLVEFYRELIALKKTYRVFTHCSTKDINFFPNMNTLALFYELEGGGFEEPDFFVAVNANHRHPSDCHLPDGKWQILLTNGDRSGVVSGKLTVHQTEALILMKID